MDAGPTEHATKQRRERRQFRWILSSRNKSSTGHSKTKSNLTRTDTRRRDLAILPLEPIYNGSGSGCRGVTDDPVICRCTNGGGIQDTEGRVLSIARDSTSAWFIRRRRAGKIRPSELPNITLDGYPWFTMGRGDLGEGLEVQYPSAFITFGVGSTSPFSAALSNWRINLTVIA